MATVNFLVRLITQFGFDLEPKQKSIFFSSNGATTFHIMTLSLATLVLTTLTVVMNLLLVVDLNVV